jgi:hypothetical protein
MAGDAPIRHYVVLEATSELMAAYQKADLPAIVAYLSKLIDEPLDKLRFDIVALPSDWRLVLKGGGPTPPAVNTVTISLEFPEIDALYTYRDRFAKVLPQGAGIGTDLPFREADHWCPGEATMPLFGTRSAANELVGIDRLWQFGLKGRHVDSGRRVNVVIVDQGVDETLIPPENFGGGWASSSAQPGQPALGEGGAISGKRPGEHGTMVARNVLGVAPDATIFDAPVIPPAIIELKGFLAYAQAAFIQMLADIRVLRESGPWSGPWVFVNAWAVYDRRLEKPAGDYTNNPKHPFNVIVEQAVAEGSDVVFAAGNCGQFCPKSRCGANDRGPGRSIFGANSHSKVLTVGAVRTDGLWLGYSSQGPGQPNLAVEKPDLCAPSQFSETGDAYAGNTGTSAACGIAAGVVAALRSGRGADRLSPDELRTLLRSSARRPPGAAWNGRFGHGILDAKCAVEAMKPLHD